MASTISGDPPLIVAFANVSTGAPTAQLWTFGDGSISIDVHPAHVYQQPGLYTVSLAVWGAEGSDVRVKRDLIAVGTLANVVAGLGRDEITEQPAWWVALAVSPWLAGAWYVVDRMTTPQVALEKVVDDGHALAALIAARDSTTSIGSLDVVIERWVTNALIGRRRANDAARDAYDRSLRDVDGLREALLLESLVRQASPEQLAGATTAVQERIQEFVASIEALGREQ